MKINIVNCPLISPDWNLDGYVDCDSNIYVTTYKNPLFFYTLLHELIHLVFHFLHAPKHFHYWHDVINASMKIISGAEKRNIIYNNKWRYFG